MQLLSDAEFTIMEIIWNAEEPVGSYEIAKSTTLVASHIQYALRALLNKNLIRIVGEESNVRNRTRRVYKPSISKADYLVLVIRKYLDILMARSIVSRDIGLVLGAVLCLAQWSNPAIRSIFPKCFPPQSSMGARSLTSLASKASKYCSAHLSASLSNSSSLAVPSCERFSKS